MAYGAGMMLVPIFLAICAVDDLDAGHQAAFELMSGNVGAAFLVALAHTAALTAAGGLIAMVI